MFPDSKIATKYGSGQTKTSCIVETFANLDENYLAEIMRKQPFNIATDGSNDFEAVKLYPVAVRIIDNIAGRVLSSLLSVQQCEQASTGDNIFHILNNELSRLIFSGKTVSFSKTMHLL